MKLSRIFRQWNIRKTVCAALLLLETVIMVHSVFMVLSVGVNGKGAGEVITVTLELVSLILGVFLFAGACGMQGASEYYLGVAFLLHILLAGDLSVWLLYGHADSRGLLLVSMHLVVLADCFLAPAYLLMLRQMTGMGRDLRELIRCRTAFDRTETAAVALGVVLMLFLFFRNLSGGEIFRLDGNAGFIKGKYYDLFFMIPNAVFAFGLVRLCCFLAPLRWILPVFLTVMIPFINQALYSCGILLELDYPCMFFLLFLLFGEAFTALSRSSDRYGAVLDTYVYPGVSEQLLAGERAGTCGKPYTGSALVCDLRSFTAFSEKRPAEDTAEILNRYMAVMMRTVTENGGTIAEFLGDGLLCVFGAPVPAEDHADRALQAARSMQQAMEEVNAWNRERSCPDLEMGIGISSGRFLFGSVGTSRTLRLMALGAPVDEAFHACDAAQGGQVLITDGFRKELQKELKKELPVQEFFDEDKKDGIRYFAIR